MSIDEQSHSDRSSTSRINENVEKIRKLIREDQRRTIEKLVEVSGVAWNLKYSLANF